MQSAAQRKLEDEFVVYLRASVLSDESLIYSSWLNGARNSGVNKRIPTSNFFEAQKRKVGRLLSRASVVVACNTEDFDHVYGYVVFEQLPQATALHYLYTKLPYRHLGVARRLLASAMRRVPASAVAVTHLSASHSFQNKLKQTYGVIYDPSLAE